MIRSRNSDTLLALSTRSSQLLVSKKRKGSLEKGLIPETGKGLYKMSPNILYCQKVRKLRRSNGDIHAGDTLKELLVVDAGTVRATIATMITQH